MTDANHEQPPAFQPDHRSVGSASSPHRATPPTKRVFFANLRHELRTPLNAILGYSEILLEDAAAENQTNLLADLHNVHAGGTELLALVNDLLDPGTIESMQHDGDARNLGTKLRHTFHPSISAIIGYTERLLQNAATHNQTQAGDDLQTIHTAAARLLLLIDDLVTIGQYTGSELDAGVTTEDTAALQHNVTGTAGVADAASTSKRYHGLVLVVDDTATNRDMLARRLKREGHATVAVENGRQALEIIKTQPFDVVLLDIKMPEMNGYQVLQQIKADPDVQDLPVIMISALDELDSVVRCITLGAADYLLKPFNPVLLSARVGACLEQKRLRDQEVEYLRNVSAVIAAAAAVEAGEFTPDSLEKVARRQDALGQLGRVFQRMAREVYTREQRLRQQVQELRIEIDEAKKVQQVAEITETEYFQQLQEKAQKLRSKKNK